MSTFVSYHRIKDAMGNANEHAMYRMADTEDASMFPIVVVSYDYGLTVPAFGAFQEVRTKLTHYKQQFVTAFRCSKERAGEAGTGFYGVGVFEQSSPRQWACASLLFGDVKTEPALIKTRHAALALAEEMAREYDHKDTRFNETAILDGGLMEASMLNMLVSSLARATADSLRCRIGVRREKIALLLEDDKGEGQLIQIPPASFLSRDDAAGAVLQQIAYAADRHVRTLAAA